MPTKIGPFEILSELAKSPTGAVYKANEGESGQTVALKTIQLSAFGEQAAALEQALLQECESVKVLASPNLTCVSNPSVIDGQFCAVMEYVQGNSIATMLARNEGFSIWDLLDIGRQLGGGLDHALSHHIVHYSLEPSKIMCGWDGTVKILSFGVSAVGNFVQHAAEGVSSILYYMSPEQIRGEAIDNRSNLFSLGAIFYEMVTEKKPFDGADVASLRQNILESTPVPPVQLNAKVHPLLSDLIMKALAKDPAQRYQTGRLLLDDLENCKEARPAAKKAPVAPKSSPVSNAVNTAAQAKFVGASVAAPQAAAPVVARPAASPAPVSSAPAQSAPIRTAAPVRPPAAKSALAQPVSRLATPQAAAAAAGARASVASPGRFQAPSPSMQAANSSAAEEPAAAYMSSAATEEPQVETFEPGNFESGPKIAVDPMMAESAPVKAPGSSFSEISELPPLKEVYIAPPPRPVDIPQMTVTPLAAAGRGVAQKSDKPEKPRVQPREVAGKALKEIQGVPPKLMMYSIGGAAALILAIAIGVFFYIHSQSSDDDADNKRPVPAATEPAPAQPEAAQPVNPPDQAPAQAEAQPVEVPETAAAQPEQVTTSRTRAPRRRAAEAAVMPGQLIVDSNPQGAQVQVDGRSDSSWVTPFSLNNVQAGQHSITVSKSGYATDTRSVQVSSGGRVSTTIRLSQLTAMLVVRSSPPGAEIYIDSRNVGTKTPAQVSVSKGQHLVLVRMPGYLDETMNAQFVLGQTFNFSPTLRPLGNIDSIRTVGKMSKLFGKGGQAGQGAISIRTQPKGAQIAINQHMLDKNSPVDVMLDPGNYEIDITLSGYAPVHTVVTSERGGKAIVDEVLRPQ